MNIENMTEADIYKQVVVWPYTTLDGEPVQSVIDWVSENLNGTRIKDVVEHKISSERTDIVFRVNVFDIEKFAVPRLMVGMRWLEDVVANDPNYIAPKGYSVCW